MVVGTLVCDLLLGDVRSLKEKRAVVRPVVAELRRRLRWRLPRPERWICTGRAEVSVARWPATHAHVRRGAGQL